MHRRHWLYLLAAVFLGLAPAAQAQDCAGFTDVSAASSFCPNVEWLKNRQITLGCTSPTLFCPGDAVPRLQMAAFLNRVGTALTPEIEFVDLSVGAVNIQASSTNYVCQSTPYPVTGFPRKAVVHALWWGNVDAPVTWSADLWYSTDGGTTWAFMSNLIPGILASAVGYTQATTFAQTDLSVGLTYIFSIRIREYVLATGGTGNFTDGRCHMMVEIRNRNGTSSPLDAAAARVSDGSNGANAE